MSFEWMPFTTFQKFFPAWKDVEEVVEDMERELFSMTTVLEKGWKRDVPLPNGAAVT